ncbi:ubiquinone biosynthesis accessory factor UbiJ [Ferrimonas pelagia]|uniref:Ubiquinone biosynthesis accessory factor UbiJ n=1 Tax=Ferrimonas pelagia TaxID=1177826 RepID=A0ABP9F314_9GAMM
MQIATLAAGWLETALASLLKFHPDPRPLASWQGQRIQLDLAELKFPLYLVITDPIQVYSRCEGPIDCQLTLSLATLGQLRRGDSLSELIKQDRLTIEGDIQLAGKLAHLLGAIEPDLTAPLSKLVGDGMAYRLDQLARNGWQQGAEQLSRLQRHSGTFLRDELQLAPCATELAQFGQEIDALAQRVAQLDARLSRHQGVE